MSIESENTTQRTTAALMSEIILDIQNLFEQQMKLTQLEIEEELQRRAKGTAVIVIGLSVVFLAAVVSSFALVHLLRWITTTVTSEDWLPLWGCHAIVAAFLFSTGFVMTYSGRQMFHSSSSRKRPGVESSGKV
jgi:hypothetical protein